MGFFDTPTNIGGKEVKVPRATPAPEPENYEPDPEDIPDIPEVPPDLPVPEIEEPTPVPRSSNPFGNNPFFDDNNDPDKLELNMPDEKLQGFNDDDRKKMEQAEKELESKEREADCLTDEKSEGEKISENSEIKQEIEDEEAREQEKVCIAGIIHSIEDCTQSKAEDNDDKSCDTKEAREPYSLDAMATVPKITFAKPKEAGGGLKKLLIFLCACIAVGIFLGMKANSYWVDSGMKSSGLESCFLWLTKEGLKTTLSPLSPQIFGTGVAVGAGLLGIIGLFVYLESDQKKRSRVGHEHGSTHIAGRKDFTVYKNKFMEE